MSDETVNRIAGHVTIGSLINQLCVLHTRRYAAMHGTGSDLPKDIDAAIRVKVKEIDVLLGYQLSQSI